MGKKPESYYLSAEDALSLVAKSINIKIDVDKNELVRLFKQYDRNNINDTVKLKNFFLSLGLVLQEVHFNGSEDLLNEAMPIILLTPDMEWMACIGGGKKFKLIEAGGQICEVSLSAERLALISAFRLQPLQKVVDGIRVINILRQALSTNKIFYSKYFFSSFFMALFALTIPVFSNLYYDKLVPSASTASLFGIVFIAALFIIFEFILRSSKDIYQSIISRKDDVDIDVSFLEAVIYNKKKDGRSMSSAFVLWHEFQKSKASITQYRLSALSGHSFINYLYFSDLSECRMGGFYPHFYVFIFDINRIHSSSLHIFINRKAKKSAKK